MTDVQLVDAPKDLLLGVVRASPVVLGPSSTVLNAELERTLAAAVTRSDDLTQKAIRDLLRTSTYKPTGRGKPASEYLAQAAREGRYPRINNLVDINNLISLETGWPCSILDEERALGRADGFDVRRGRADEEYTFNAAGHVMSLHGLLCVARQGGACVGNPVKDSMEAKLTESTRSVVVFVYASRLAADRARMDAALTRLREMLRVHASAQEITALIATAD